jgi:hypothetical protein
MAEPGTGKPRVGNFLGAFMVAVAILLDLLQFLITFIPVVGTASIFVTMVGISAFGIWFLLLGVPYMSGSKSGMKIGAFFIGIVVEALPFINALPGLTGSVLTVFLASRLEDRVRAARPERKKQRMRLQTTRVTPNPSNHSPANAQEKELEDA